MSAFIDQERERFAVDLICRTLGVSPSAYYQRATGKRSARAREDERLLTRIREVHAARFSSVEGEGREAMEVDVEGAMAQYEMDLVRIFRSE